MKLTALTTCLTLLLTVPALSWTVSLESVPSTPLILTVTQSTDSDPWTLRLKRSLVKSAVLWGWRVGAYGKGGLDSYQHGTYGQHYWIPWQLKDPGGIVDDWHFTNMGHYAGMGIAGIGAGILLYNSFLEPEQRWMKPWQAMSFVGGTVLDGAFWFRRSYQQGRFNSFWVTDHTLSHNQKLLLLGSKRLIKPTANWQVLAWDVGLFWGGRFMRELAP